MYRSLYNMGCMGIANAGLAMRHGCRAVECGCLEANVRGSTQFIVHVSKETNLKAPSEISGQRKRRCTKGTAKGCTGVKKKEKEPKLQTPLD